MDRDLVRDVVSSYLESEDSIKKLLNENYKISTEYNIYPRITYLELMYYSYWDGKFNIVVNVLIKYYYFNIDTFLRRIDDYYINRLTIDETYLIMNEVMKNYDINIDILMESYKRIVDRGLNNIFTVWMNKVILNQI